MGQATVDLPNPLEPSPQADAGGVDDLLSQLAGDEIERLLSSSSSDPSGPSAASPADDASHSDAAGVDEMDSDVAAALAALGGGDAPDAVADAKPTAKSDDAILSAEMDDAFNRLAGPEPKAKQGEPDPSGAARVDGAAGAPIGEANVAAPDAPNGAPSADATEPDGSIADVFAQVSAADAAKATGATGQGLPANDVAAKAPAEAGGPLGNAGVGGAGASANDGAVAPSAEFRPPEPDVSTAAAERAALDLSGVATDAEAADADAAGAEADALLGSEPAGAGGALSGLVQILEKINAPLDACPDAIRDAIGKVAVLTFINALAILVYVLFFRRH